MSTDNNVPQDIPNAKVAIYKNYLAIFIRRDVLPYRISSRKVNVRIIDNRDITIRPGTQFNYDRSGNYYRIQLRTEDLENLGVRDIGKTMTSTPITLITGAGEFQMRLPANGDRIPPDHKKPSQAVPKQGLFVKIGLGTTHKFTLRFDRGIAVAGERVSTRLNLRQRQLFLSVGDSNGVKVIENANGARGEPFRFTTRKVSTALKPFKSMILEAVTTDTGELLIQLPPAGDLQPVRNNGRSGRKVTKPSAPEAPVAPVAPTPRKGNVLVDLDGETLAYTVPTRALVKLLATLTEYEC